MRRYLRLIFCGIIIVLSSCETLSQDSSDSLQSEHVLCPSDISYEEHLGALNAVKKAYQLTDIKFTPVQSIAYNRGYYEANTTYQGMIYSSVKEIGTYVGTNVSFYTFVTAINNPRSKIYTERINRTPYHGTNSTAYYGTVCSGLVSYALGLFPLYGSYDFPTSERMSEIDYTNPDNLHIADVLWRPGHVAIITDIIRDSKGKVISIELSEAVQSGCRRRLMTRQAFVRIMESPYEKVLRYKDLYMNTIYYSCPDIVAVFDEIPVPFEFSSICVDKGDRSCYLLGEDVVINVLSDYDYVDVYKDDVFFARIEGNDSDIVLSNLDYGFYRAQLFSGSEDIESTSWVVVDYYVNKSQTDFKLFFSSKNSNPLSFFFCKESGSRGRPFTEVLCRSFTKEEINEGFVSLSQESILDDLPFFVVSFETEYGIITSRPLNWFN